MAKYQLKTFADIVEAVREELKIQSSDTTSINRIKRDINMVYLNEVLPFDQWYFSRKTIKLTHEKYYNTGTASVTQDSSSVTLSTAPTVSLRGKLFASDSFAEVYKIVSHNANSTSITLDAPYRGATNSAINFKVYQEGMVLPVDFVEGCKVWHDRMEAPMESIGDHQFLELTLHSPKREGRPRWYRVTDIDDPNPFDAISGLPALSTRASSGQVRTLVFGSSVESYLEVGDRVKIHSSANANYNGEFIIESVSTTTIQYIADEILDENATADLNLTLEKKNDPDSDRVNKLMQVYPALDTENVTVNVEYMMNVDALESDSDQPIVPLQDRIVLVYGALARAWSRNRNPEEASKNSGLFYQKLSRMAGKVKDSTDVPQLNMDKFYMAGKRRARRTSWSTF